jgi:hypothetical protein
VAPSRGKLLAALSPDDTQQHRLLARQMPRVYDPFSPHDGEPPEPEVRMRQVVVAVVFMAGMLLLIVYYLTLK